AVCGTLRRPLDGDGHQPRAAEAGPRLFRDADHDASVSSYLRLGPLGSWGLPARRAAAPGAPVHRYDDALLACGRPAVASSGQGPSHQRDSYDRRCSMSGRNDRYPSLDPLLEGYLEYLS